MNRTFLAMCCMMCAVAFQSAHGVTIFEAIENGDVNQVQAAIEGGADVNAKNRCRETPLHEAAQQGNDAVVQLLISKGADVNATDERGWTSLHKAAKKGNVDVVKLLINSRACLNTVADGTPGGTPLSVAAYYGNVDVVKLLISKDVDINVRDALHSCTPLHWAAHNGYVDIVRLLLERNANPTLRDREGKTPVDRARNSASYDRWDPRRGEKRAEMISLLEQAEASWRAAHPESSPTPSN
jgi:ankyrin repeat protein